MSSLFGGTPAPTPLPKPTPMVNEDVVAKKKKELTARAQQRGGRESTILGSSETLG
jgi:hypothetical protein